jgi:anthranilate/para-aminobenzoate synthase component I
VLSFARYDALIARSHRSGESYVVGDDESACDRLLLRLTRPAQRLSARVGAVAAAPPEQHREAIERALQHIAAGDIYQVNLARMWQATFAGAPLALWLAMREQGPVPLGFYYDDGERSVLGRTMERFLRWDRSQRSLSSRPIKGTIARAGDRDAHDAAALRGDAKERAEHAMIVDLMRNDLGRVAEVGSVQVPEVMVVEPYAGLAHLVSTVTCRTRPHVTLRQVLDATFPPGSVTGTPKLRAMRVIESLEAVARDVYTGAVGYVDRQGGLSLAVAIRCATVERDTVRYYAGGGIVEASEPERELAETELKARVFLEAAAALGVEFPQ